LSIGHSNKSSWFHKLIESTEDPITVVSASSGRFVSVNAAFGRKVGFDRQELLGKTPFEIGFLEDRPFYDRFLREPLAAGGNEFEFRTKAGNLRCAQAISMAIEVAGQACFIIIWRDITERKQFEDDLIRANDLALESARLKSEFLAKVSHELRTPLNGIIGMAQLLLDTQLTSEQQEFADTIESSSAVLLKVVSDILDFSKTSELSLEDVKEFDFKLRQVVEAALALHGASASAKGLRIRLSILPSIPDTLRGDPDRLGQVIANLVNNAVKFTDAGEVEVSVKLEGVRDERWRLRFEVRDTGIGLSLADQSRLFRPFVQADGSATRKYGGTGMGLALCAKLVAMMHGKIGIISTPGTGSTFYFSAEFVRAVATS
jgi:PAS domain S-box-containing protein